MNKIFIIISIVFLAGCAPKQEKNNEQDKKVAYSESFLRFKEKAASTTSQDFDVKQIGVNELISSNKINLIDTDYYTSFLSEYLRIEDGSDKLYYYSVNEKQRPVNASIIRVTKLNTTIYTLYLVIFDDDFEIQNVIEFSKYESYPGGEISMRSVLVEDNKYLQTTLESFVDGYDNENKRAIITTDSISCLFKIAGEESILLNADTTRYTK